MERFQHLKLNSAWLVRIMSTIALLMTFAASSFAFEIWCPKDTWIWDEDMPNYHYEKPVVNSYYHYDIWGPWEEKHINCGEGYIKVTWKIKDHHGDWHYCYQTITVKAKHHYGSISVDCPNDKTVSCDDLHYLKYEKPYVHSYGHYEIYGPWVDEHLNSCGVGKILVTWKIVDDCGQWQECHQYIWVKQKSSYDSYYGPVTWWPKDYLTDYCEGDLSPDNLPKGYDYPKLASDEHNCSSLGISYSDEVFYPYGDADFCYKILRTWKVIDWCSYDPYDHYGHKGLWEHVQVIKVHGGGEAPDLECPDDITVSVSGHDNEAYVELDPVEASSSNSCSDKLYVSNNSKYADHNGADASGYYPIGVHWVSFWAKDGCHNTAECKVKITVEDQIAPTPYCVASLVTVIAWHEDGVYTKLDPKKFDLGSYDNYSPKNKLKFTMDPPVLDCSNLDTNEVKMWVEDEFGNKDFCTVQLIIQDNMGMCPRDSTEGLYSISGSIKTEAGQPVVNAIVSFANDDTVSAVTAANGAYQSLLLRPDRSYSVIPTKEAYPMDGVNTKDYILLYQYVMGNATLDSPYKIIAADVNGDHQVTFDDVFALGSMILSKEESMPAGMHSWRFIDAHYQFAHPSDPFQDDFHEYMTVSTLADHMEHMDFIGIKIGDVDGSVGGLEAREEVDRQLIIDIMNRLAPQVQQLKATVYPNPFHQEAILEIESPQVDQATIILHDVTGKTLYQAQQQLVQGINQVALPAQSLQSQGIYYYRVLTSTGSASGKVLKVE